MYSYEAAVSPGNALRYGMFTKSVYSTHDSSKAMFWSLAYSTRLNEKARRC